ncbi:unnamed protein product [marine sediment metagenome]|uniref:Uncharacterized protein n=1 Tax=marine sediment metagenome TaxID=412755 RepID=X1S2T7_9ZZZZ
MEKFRIKYLFVIDNFMRKKEELSETYDIKSWRSIHVSQL